VKAKVYPETPSTGKPRLAKPLAVEEPLEIRLEHWGRGQLHRKSVSITMRTPGHDAELAAGFLFTEGIVNQWDDVADITPCGPLAEAGPFQNIIRVELKPTITVKTDSMERNFYTTSSCGICGKTSLEALKINNRLGSDIKTYPAVTIDRKVLVRLPGTMVAHQQQFQETAGSHASALFDLKGQLQCLREDIGRHNALDKVVGWALQRKLLPLQHYILVVSGRTSFELMQKASMAGIPTVAAVGAPSSLAVQVAQDLGMMLIGFLNHDGFTVYNHPRKIDLIE
jgi:FdhD protein